jgi:hypothetical protein
MTDAPHEGGFNRRRPTDNGYILSLREHVGLSADASLEEAEPVVIEMMRGKKIIEGMELVLGRQIDAQDVMTDPNLRDVSMLAMSNPEQAFGGLLLVHTLEEMQAEK